MKTSMLWSTALLVCSLGACHSNVRHQDEMITSPADLKDLDDPERVVQDFSCKKTAIEGYFGGTTIMAVDSNQAYYYKSGMTIDADGSPHAYHPISDKGLDNLSAAGYEGNWWGLATEGGNRYGAPLVQKAGDPAPGFYISTTSLFDSSLPESNPRRFVDAETIPYISIPNSLTEKKLVKVGDIAVVYNFDNEKLAYAEIGDVGNDYHAGEGSMALAKLLDIDSNPRNGGKGDGVAYLIFPKSGTGKPLDINTINQKGKDLFDKWGGIERLYYCVGGGD